MTANSHRLFNYQHNYTMSAHGDSSALPPNPPSSASAVDPNLVATCHCGRVRVELPSAPENLNECRCSVCYKYGALWAYYTRSSVTVTVAADDDKRRGVPAAAYIRDDELGKANLSFNRCGHCGCMTHWWRIGEHANEDVRMGVNARMLPEAAIEGVERRVSRK